MSAAPRELSLWQTTAVPSPALPQLCGAETAETAIIGAGYSGLSTALALAEKGVSAIVLEAEEPGAGASGRSGGQVIAGLRHFVDDVVDFYGRERGRRLFEFGAGTADATFALIKRLGLDCDAKQSGWIQAADTETALAEARRRVESWKAFGAPTRLLDQMTFRRMTGCEAYLGGWIDERGGSLHPLSYVRELARAAVKVGARVYARSPATQITRQGADWRIETPQGAVTARRVLIATNALTDGLWPGLAATLIPVWSFQVATAPLAPDADVLSCGAVISDTRRILRYFRRDREGRLIVGGKGALRGPRGLGSFDLQRRMIARLYPELAKAPLTHYWGGQVAVTLDRLPRLFRLDDGVFATIGCNGRGVAWTTALGAPLAEALCGAPLESLPLPPAEPLRPIPLHRLKLAYAAIGGAWLRFRDRLEALSSPSFRKASS
jgi:glycine/D-amino acid oxidase-like deaminating enzyme